MSDNPVLSVQIIFQERYTVSYEPFFLLLMGTVVCTSLPLLQIDVPQYTTLQLPITAVRHLLTEKDVNIERKGSVDEKHLFGETNLLWQGKEMIQKKIMQM